MVLILLWGFEFCVNSLFKKYFCSAEQKKLKKKILIHKINWNISTLMGYDHFVLLSVDSAVLENEKSIKKLELACEKTSKEIRSEVNEPLFGNVFHLGSGEFSKEHWWPLFDKFVAKLYKRTKIHHFYLYVCEFDGESLQKHTYIDGKRNSYIDVKMTVNDPGMLCCSWNIESLQIKNNITIMCNDDYGFDWE